MIATVEGIRTINDVTNNWSKVSVRWQDCDEIRRWCKKTFGRDVNQLCELTNTRGNWCILQDGHWYDAHCTIFFKNESDMALYLLKWGINGYK